MGIRTVAVYSTADKEALHVQLAHEAVCIGKPRPADSYLNMNAILQAACSTGCDAIHPGFGFLSENPQFAALVEQCGLIFIGPRPDVIEKLGNKSMARAMMLEAGVPVVPGSKQIIHSVEEGLELAKEITYPLIIKAANGGGGRGMRIVRSEDEFEHNFYSAKSEAKACFGDDDVYMEKYIENPKHVEVQVLCDEYGNCLHLFERDCSFQRRNQKMIEEAPCHALDDTIRQNMFEDALKACRYVGYTSAGTIEFLLSSDGKYYFMEMNTRIQVEHGVTEMVTGTDLIIEQIRVAMGEELSFKQEDIRIKGHAIECRINAEIPEKNFMPSPGVVQHMHLPAGNGVRVDTALYTGYKIPSEYDSMIAKVIVHAPDREAALQKMRSALDEMVVMGVETNLDFQYQLMNNREFCEGKADTGFIERLLKLD